MDSSVARLATGASFKSSVRLPLSVCLFEKALSAFLFSAPFCPLAVQFLFSFPLLFNKISAVFYSVAFHRRCMCVRVLRGDMLYLWNLFLLLWLEKRCRGLGETNQRSKWHIDSINCLFFFQHIQNLIEYSCYLCNQWFYSHQCGSVEEFECRYLVSGGALYTSRWKMKLFH